MSEDIKDMIDDIKVESEAYKKMGQELRDIAARMDEMMSADKPQPGYAFFFGVTDPGLPKDQQQKLTLGGDTATLVKMHTELTQILLNAAPNQMIEAAIERSGLGKVDDPTR